MSAQGLLARAGQESGMSCMQRRRSAGSSGSAVGLAPAHSRTRCCTARTGSTKMLLWPAHRNQRVRRRWQARLPRRGNARSAPTARARLEQRGRRVCGVGRTVDTHQELPPGLHAGGWGQPHPRPRSACRHRPRPVARCAPLRAPPLLCSCVRDLTEFSNIKAFSKLLCHAPAAEQLTGTLERSKRHPIRLEVRLKDGIMIASVRVKTRGKHRESPRCAPGTLLAI